MNTGYEPTMNTPDEPPPRLWRTWQGIGALGVVYSILYLVGSVVLTGNGPGENASPAALAKYYTTHRNSATAGAFVIVIAMVVFAFFLSSLRRVLSEAGRDGDHFSMVMAIGGAVYIGGFLFGAVLQFALVDAAHHHQPGVLNTVNFLYQDDFLPIVAGLAITALAAGIAGLRNRALPRWLSWASVAFGLLALAGPLGALAFLVTPVWTLAVGIVLARRKVENHTMRSVAKATASV